MTLELPPSFPYIMCLPAHDLSPNNNLPNFIDYLSCPSLSSLNHEPTSYTPRTQPANQPFKMPIPIPPALDETTQSSLATEHNTTSTSTNTTNPSFSSSSSSTSQSDNDRPLSKEEADRLYEERMEEEYAKREGGA
ncbi:hypothetical protein BO99DRAFT_169188 [Aspergillus violaceofuscus CBS 115571]|uniref:Uncharacterized protein n=1 Tax=Aspergillus violaceofuscus (strain CBS 115571) TaxID=1450538 RepID=A0A2V5IFH5_ASPV1|nr:hypothetical protein BO99DRAFT_169188 [Aspergillus violaceofuscus CBS 115571]